MAATLEVILKARDEMTKVFQTTDVNFSKVAVSANKLKTSFAAMLPIAVGVAVAWGIKRMTDESLAFADGIKKTSDTMQMSTTETQTWDYVMRQAGGTVNDLSGSMQKLQALAYQASIGNKTAAESFKNAGVEIYDLNGKVKLTPQLFADTVKALQDTDNATLRAGKSTAIFGKAAKDLNPILSMTKAELKAQIDSATKYGQVLSEKAVKNLDDAGDALENFNMSMKVAKAEIVAGFIPAIGQISTTLSQGAKGLSDWARMIGTAAEAAGYFSAGKSIEWIRATRTAEEASQMSQADGIARLMKLRDEYNVKLKASQEILDKNKSNYSGITQKESTANVYEKRGMIGEKSLALNSVAKAEKDASELKEIYSVYQNAFVALVGKKSGSGASATPPPIEKQKAVLKNQFSNSEANFSQEAKSWLAGDDERVKKEAADKEIKIQQDANAWKAQLDEESFASAKKSWEDTLNAKIALHDSEVALQADGYQKELSMLQFRQSQELEMYAGNESAITALKAKNVNEQILLEQNFKKIQQQNAREGLASTASNLKNVAGQWKQFAGAYKTIAIAQATWDTYSSAVASYKAMAGIPYVGPALGVAAAAVAVASGIANIAQISSAKFARGGDFVTTGPQMIMVGDNPGGRERVSVTPTSSPNYAGPQSQGHTFIVNDYSGGFVETFRRDLRSGKADKLVSDLAEAMGVAA